MDFHKLKLEQFTTYNGYNLPESFIPPLTKSEHPDTFFCMVSSVEETMVAINTVQNKSLPKDNRVFFVFRKGNKTFGRDHVYNLLMATKRFKRKAPMLASLNKEYSIFCFQLDVT